MTFTVKFYWPLSKPSVLLPPLGNIIKNLHRATYTPLTTQHDDWLEHKSPSLVYNLTYFSIFPIHFYIIFNPICKKSHKCEEGGALSPLSVIFILIFFGGRTHQFNWDILFWGETFQFYFDICFKGGFTI